MKYAPSAESRTSHEPFWTEATRLHGLRSFQQTHQPIVSRLQSAVLALDESRLANLLADCQFRYGSTARDRVQNTLRHWRDGGPVSPDVSAIDLFSIASRQMTPAEKMALIRDVWQQWVADLPHDEVRLTIVRGSDLLAVARRLACSLRGIPTTLPGDLAAILGRRDGNDTQALVALALGTERCLITQRLAAILVHLGMLARLRALSSPPVAVHVQAHLGIPTLSVTLRFQPCFWRQAVPPSDDTSGQRLLLHLQSLALMPDTRADFATDALDGFGPTERHRLTALAVAVGLQTENLLCEIQAQTRTARADIEDAAGIAARIRAGRLRGRVVSEHALSGCTSRIEIRHAVCPLVFLRR